jgi:hypothetical protein
LDRAIAEGYAGTARIHNYPIAAPFEGKLPDYIELEAGVAVPTPTLPPGFDISIVPSPWTAKGVLSNDPFDPH